MAWREHGKVNKVMVFFLDGGKVIKEKQGIARQAQIPESHSRKTKPWCVWVICLHTFCTNYMPVFMLLMFFFFKDEGTVWGENCFRALSEKSRSMHMDRVKASSLNRLVFLGTIKSHASACKIPGNYGIRTRLQGQMLQMHTERWLIQEEPCSDPTSFLITNILRHCLSHRVYE